MSEYRWTSIRDNASRAFNSYPNAEAEATLIETFQLAPSAVLAAIDKVVERVRAGKLRNPLVGWMIVEREVENITRPTADVVATDDQKRERALALADRWVQQAGMHFPSETELLDELFGERGKLRQFTDDPARHRLLKRYRELRPVAERLDRDMLKRARDHTACFVRPRDEPA